MLSLITTHTQIPSSHQSVSRLNSRLIPSSIFVYNPKKRGRQYKKAFILRRSFCLTQVRWGPRFGRNLDSSWCCSCGQSDGDVELEAAIMDFMAKSEKPTMFPTKHELVRAGRLDLVKAIKKKGGWYSLGWDGENELDNDKDVMDFDTVEFQRKVENCKESASSTEHCNVIYSGDQKEDRFSSDVNSGSGNSDSLQLAASASLGRSLQNVPDEDSGIDGILSRLEKQRTSDFDIYLGKNGHEAQSKSKDEGDDWHFYTSLGFGRSDLGESNTLTPGYHQKRVLDTSSGNIKHYTEPQTWRPWNNQRARFHHTEFEDAEISFGKYQVDTDTESTYDGQTVTNKEYVGDWDQHKEISYNEIRTRLQHIESELTTALCSLRSKREDCLSEKVTVSSNDLHKLSDAFEFQENEFISVQERLRSIRAKLAVLEGKMALAIIDAQQLVELKQKQIDDAQKALQLLRTTCIVWPNSASEVLLAGSFDGWTTQRWMEKSKPGIFSVTLKLYPGRYEVKFLVDGKWKVDRLLPIINNNGYENNLLIVK